MGRRRRADTQSALEALVEITEMFWQVGAVVTGLLLGMTFVALRWGSTQNALGESSALLAPLMDHMGWVLYLPAVGLLALTCLLGARTWSSYRRHSRF